MFCEIATKTGKVDVRQVVVKPKWIEIQLVGIVHLVGAITKIETDLLDILFDMFTAFLRNWWKIRRFSIAIQFASGTHSYGQNFVIVKLLRAVYALTSRDSIRISPNQ